jgi:hypothetical protein
MLDLFKSADALDMSASSGPSCFAKNIEMHFDANDAREVVG